MLQRFVDVAAVAAEIERVRWLSGDALRRRWQGGVRAVNPGTPHGGPVAADDRRQDSGRAISAHCDRATLKLLDGLARRDGSRKAERNLKIGTVLVRDYQGRRHTFRSSPKDMCGRATPIPACRQSRGPSPGRPGAAHASSP
jgi:hypothetical protein